MRIPFFFTSKRNLLLLAIAVLVVCILIFLFGRRLLAEANAQHSSYQLYRIAALKALGHTQGNAQYGISGGYSFMRCNYWQGELCSGIVASRTLLESPQDLKLVVNALEEPCKYLWPKVEKSDIHISGGGNQPVVIIGKEIIDARQLAPCETGKLENGKPIFPELVDRLFIYFYDGSLEEYQSGDERLVLDIKPIKSTGDKK